MKKGLDRALKAAERKWLSAIALIVREREATIQSAREKAIAALVEPERIYNAEVAAARAYLAELAEEA